jgi:hypothetical protein
MMSRAIESIIDASDICERLVGITPIYLQNFLQRGSYGVRSSVSPGKVRSQRRLFSTEDVYGIALVWLLFESGMRGDAIGQILTDIGGTKRPDANKAADALQDPGTDYLLIIRTPRRPSKSIPQKQKQRVEIVSEEALSMYLFAKGPDEGAEDFITTDENILIVPIGDKFADVRKRLNVFFDVR